MKEVKIKDLITDKISGEWGKDPQTKENNVNVIRTANFTNQGRIDYENVIQRFIEKSKIEKKKLKNNDIIIEKSGGSPTQPVGRVVFFRQPNSEIFLTNNFTGILRPNVEKVFPQYFFYRLWYNHITKKTLKFQNKTTGIINLKLDDYLNEKILISKSLAEQKKIAYILSKAEALIQKRKDTIDGLDELLKHTFLDMFGDPVKNPKGWTKMELGNIGKSRLGKMLDSSKQTGGNTYPYLGNSNVLWGKFNLENLQKMDFSESERFEFELKEGDLIICEGGEIGRTAIWKNQMQNIYFQKALHRVRINIEKAVPDYIQYVMWFYAKLTGFKSIIGKATISHLTGVQLKKIKIPVPPLQLQTQFAEKVDKIEALKAKQEASLRELEQLYHSLMQRAFKGELDLERMEDRQEAIAEEAEKGLHSKYDDSEEPKEEDSPNKLKDEVKALNTRKESKLTEIEDILKQNEFSPEIFWKVLRLAEHNHGIYNRELTKIIEFNNNNYQLIKEFMFNELKNGTIEQKYNNNHHCIALIFKNET